MKVVISIDTTGPDPSRHEVLQIGMVCCEPDLKAEIARFAAYVRPARLDEIEPLYLRRAGIRSLDEMKERMEHWDTKADAWGAASRFLVRHAAKSSAPLKRVMQGITVVAYEPAMDVPFLVAGLYGCAGFHVPKNVMSLRSSLLDYKTSISYLGVQWEAPQTLEGVMEALNVSCRNMRDAAARADAIRECYRRLLERQSKLYGKPKKDTRGGPKRKIKTPYGKRKTR